MSPRAITPWRRGGPAVLVTTTLALGACESTVEQASTVRPMPPRPVAAPQPPREAQANSLALLVLGPKAQDTNGNGWGDLVVVEVFLFAEPHPTPILEEGRFVFEVQPCPSGLEGEAIPVRTFVFEGAQVASARAKGLIGASHRFSLSLIDSGGEFLPCPTADVSARFEPADGRPAVHAVGVRSVQIGKAAGATAR